MRIRQVLLVVTIAAALALPALTYLVLEAGYRHQGLKLALADLERQESGLDEYTRHAERFRSHVALLKAFSEAAGQFGVTDANWDMHKVDIDKMFVSYSELEGFVADMSSVQDSYFIPEKLHFETRPTVTYEDLAATTRRGKPSEGGVVLSLTGEFMVTR